MLLVDDLPEDQLHIYGEIECQLWDNYPDCNPKPKGYVLKRGIHKFYAFRKESK